MKYSPFCSESVRGHPKKTIPEKQPPFQESNVKKVPKVPFDIFEAEEYHLSNTVCNHQCSLKPGRRKNVKTRKEHLQST